MSRRARQRLPAIEAKRAAAWSGPDPDPVDDREGGQPDARPGLLAQIEACRREVAQWPEWMRATTTAPKWMEGWDD